MIYTLFSQEYPCLGIISPRALTATPSSTAGGRVGGRNAVKWERCWDSCFTSISVRWIGLWRNHLQTVTIMATCKIWRQLGISGYVS